MNLTEAFQLYTIAIVLLCIGTIASFFIIKTIILTTGKGKSLLRPSKFNNLFDRILLSFKSCKVGKKKDE